MAGISLAEMSRRLHRITEPMLQEEVEEIILTHQKEVKQLKEAELLQGKNPDGSQIGRYRSYSYAVEKNRQNPIAGFGNVDLIKTGRFLNELYPYRKTQNRYLFANRIQYGRDLIEKYGQGVLGLNQAEFYKLQKDVFKPLLIRFIKKQIGQ